MLSLRKLKKNRGFHSKNDNYSLQICVKNDLSLVVCVMVVRERKKQIIKILISLNDFLSYTTQEVRDEIPSSLNGSRIRSSLRQKI